MKNAEAAISSRRRSKKFEGWSRGLKKFRTVGVTDLGGVTFAGGEGSVPHYMPWFLMTMLEHIFIRGSILRYIGS